MSLFELYETDVYLGSAEKVCGASDTKPRGEVVLEYYDAEAMQ
jgi:hypothetical protein